MNTNDLETKLTDKENNEEPVKNGENSTDEEPDLEQNPQSIIQADDQNPQSEIKKSQSENIDDLSLNPDEKIKLVQGFRDIGISKEEAKAFLSAEEFEQIEAELLESGTERKDGPAVYDVESNDDTLQGYETDNRVNVMQGSESSSVSGVSPIIIRSTEIYNGEIQNLGDTAQSITDGSSPQTKPHWAKHKEVLTFALGIIIITLAVVLLIKNMKGNDQIGTTDMEQQPNVSIYALIDSNNIVGLEQYLDQTGSNTYYSSNSDGPVIYAVKNRNIDALRVLLRHPSLAKEVVTVVHAWEAMKYCMYRPCKYGSLLKLAEDDFRIPGLLSSFDYLGAEMAALLLDAGINPDMTNPATGRPLISQAVLWGNMPIVNLLAKRGADVNAGDSVSNTPMMYCARFNLDAGSDGYQSTINEIREVIDPIGTLTDEELGWLYRSLTTLVFVTLHTDYGVDINQKNNYGSTVFHWAVNNGRFEFLAFIDVP